MSRRILLASITAILCLLWQATETAGQRFASRKSVIQKGGLRVDRNDFRWKEGRITLMWEMNPGNEQWRMPIRFTDTAFIYYIERHGPEGTDAFGRTAACVDELRQEGNTVDVSPQVNLDKSYYIKLVKPKHFQVEVYEETREIEYLFETANDILKLRIIPIYMKEQPTALGYSDFTAGVRLMFPMRKFMTWKD